MTEGGSVIFTTKKSRNLAELEQNKNIPGDIMGATDTGISESDSGLVGNIKD